MAQERKDSGPTEEQGAGQGAAPPPGAQVRHGEPTHSLLDEEPLGWDQAPTDRTAPEDARHPAHRGTGGNPEEPEGGDYGTAEEHGPPHGPR